MARKTSKELQQPLLAWIKKQMTEKGLTDGDVADAIGVDRAVFNKLKNGNRKATWPEVVKLAQLFNSEPPTNLPLVSGGALRTFVGLRKSVALNVWRRADAPMSKAQIEVRQLPIDPYEGLEQYARLVEDDHATRYVPKGFYLICVDYKSARPHPVHGDHVVIERKRSTREHGEELFELSIRQVVRRGERWSLHSLAVDPDLFPDIPYDGDTPNLRICDLIIARHANG